MLLMLLTWQPYRTQSPLCLSGKYTALSAESLQLVGHIWDISGLHNLPYSCGCLHSAVPSSILSPSLLLSSSRSQAQHHRKSWLPWIAHLFQSFLYSIRHPSQWADLRGALLFLSVVDRYFGKIRQNQRFSVLRNVHPSLQSLWNVLFRFWRLVSWLSLVLLGFRHIAYRAHLLTTSTCMLKGLSGSPSILPRTAGSPPDSYSDVCLCNTWRTGSIVADSFCMCSSCRFFFL